MSTKQFNFPDTVPLVQWEDGSIRVQGTRLLLAMIVTSFQQGYTADEINDSFPSASVPQIEGVIDWYLDNKSAADAYLEEEEAEGERILLRIQSRPEHKAASERLHTETKCFVSSPTKTSIRHRARFESPPAELRSCICQRCPAR